MEIQSFQIDIEVLGAKFRIMPTIFDPVGGNRGHRRNGRQRGEGRRRAVVGGTLVLMGPIPGEALKIRRRETRCAAREGATGAGEPPTKVGVKDASAATLQAEIS
jgi:hypothetical protein